MGVGLYDNAERLYARVAAADPHNSIAVTGLARVALERGDQLGAYLLARKALAIDADNPVAGHLARRMAEQLQMRGEALPGQAARTAPSRPAETAAAVLSTAPEPGQEAEPASAAGPPTVPGPAAGAEPGREAGPASASEAAPAPGMPDPSSAPAANAEPAVPTPARGLIARLLRRRR